MVQNPPSASPATIKRPLGLTLIGIVWSLTGIYNLYVSTTNINGDLNAIQYLSDPHIDQWYKLGIPADIVLNATLFVFTVFQFVAIIGLWTKRRWSYTLALLMPVLIASINASSIALYYSAPASLGLTSGAPIGGTVAGFFWIYVYWVYLRRPHVREYLQVQDSQLKA